MICASAMASARCSTQGRTLVWVLAGESAVALDSLCSGISTSFKPAAPASHSSPHEHTLPQGDD